MASGLQQPFFLGNLIGGFLKAILSFLQKTNPLSYYFLKVKKFQCDKVKIKSFRANAPPPSQPV